MEKKCAICLLLALPMLSHKRATLLGIDMYSFEWFWVDTWSTTQLFQLSSLFWYISLRFLCLSLNLQVHFVEMDPWVVSNVLIPNLEWTGFLDVSSIHTVRVETFLQRAEQFVGVWLFSLLSVFSNRTSFESPTKKGKKSNSLHPLLLCLV